MIAIAQRLKDTIEIRKFATGMEEVLKVEHDQNSFPGKFITEEEREKNKLKKPKSDL